MSIYITLIKGPICAAVKVTILCKLMVSMVREIRENPYLVYLFNISTMGISFHLLVEAFRNEMFIFLLESSNRAVETLMVFGMTTLSGGVSCI